MRSIDVEKRFPHIPDEDVTRIFQDGYMHGRADTMRHAIPEEFVKKKLARLEDDIKWRWYYGNVALDKMEYTRLWIEQVLLEEWEKEKENEKDI